ncbi:MAG: hypothetical protein AB7W16_28495 [Candidatus Obscuribacterales bacterium]
MAKKFVRITHRPTGQPLAEGPIGWGITPFEGNFYIRRKYLLTDRLIVNFVPGFCFYKFFYVWLDYMPEEGKWSRMIGWKYWLPNPLFPFIWFRVGLPRFHPELLIEDLIEDDDAPDVTP